MLIPSLEAMPLGELIPLGARDLLAVVDVAACADFERSIIAFSFVEPERLTKFT
jgi:hypothetical protein